MSSDVEIFRRLRALEAEVRRERALGYTPLSGSFTPELLGSGGGSATYTANGQIGRYVRVGTLVQIWTFLSIASTSLSGSLSFVLPYTSVNATNVRNVILGIGELVNLTANYTTLYGLVLPGSAEFRIREAGDNVATNAIQGSQIQAGTVLEFTGAYVAAG